MHIKGTTMKNSVRIMIVMLAATRSQKFTQLYLRYQGKSFELRFISFTSTWKQNAKQNKSM